MIYFKSKILNESPVMFSLVMTLTLKLYLILQNSDLSKHQKISSNYYRFKYQRKGMEVNQTQIKNRNPIKIEEQIKSTNKTICHLP